MQSPLLLLLLQALSACHVERAFCMQSPLLLLLLLQALSACFIERAFCTQSSTTLSRATHLNHQETKRVIGNIVSFNRL